MLRTEILGISAAAVLCLAGTAQAQSQTTSERESGRIASALGNKDVDLAAAIEAAEKKSTGKAIRANIRQLTEREIQQTAELQRNKVKPMDAPTRTAADAAKREANAQSDSQRLIAVVTCVTDNGLIRDYYVNLSNNEVLGVSGSSMRRENSNRRTTSARDNHGRGEYGSSEGYRDADAIHLISGSDLMNATVENFEGNTLGHIDDLAIEPSSGRLVYGVLARGGLWGIGETNYAIPSDEVSDYSNGVVLIDLTEKDFEDAKGFPSGKWPMRADSQWDTNWITESEQMPEASSILRGSDLLGMEVTDNTNEEVGNVQDVIVDAKHGRAVYVVIKTGDGLIPVPFAALTIAEKDEQVRIQKWRSDLRNMTALTREGEMNWSSARWNRRIHEAFGQKPAWVEELPERDSD